MEATLFTLFKSTAATGNQSVDDEFKRAADHPDNFSG